MKIKRKKLVNEMINLYGAENGMVKLFTELCENSDDSAENDKMLEVLVQCHKENPVE